MFLEKLLGVGQLNSLQYRRIYKGEETFVDGTEFYCRQEQVIHLLRSVSRPAEAHPASYPIGTGDCSLGKAAGA
jgi:hypothetical protein